MRSFVYFFAGTYLAITLLLSGLGHVIRFSAFNVDVRTHGVLPSRLTWPTTVTITLLELGAGVAVAHVLTTGRDGAEMFLASLLLGLAFLGYIVNLLGRETPPASCGCSVLDTPLTPASLAPAMGLTIAALLGLAAVTFARGIPSGGPAVGLGVAWGVTFAGLTLLLPATMPEMHKARR